MSSTEIASRINSKERFSFSLNGIMSAVSSLFSSKTAFSESTSNSSQYAAIEQPKNRFLEAAARVIESREYTASTSAHAPYGFYRGRHIIGDCTTFVGGIFIGHQPQDAVVIDEQYGILNQVYETLLSRIANISSNTAHAEHEIFHHVIAFAAQVIRIDEKEMARFAAEQRLGFDDKISLDVYITQGFGLEYHQVLLAGYLLEKLALSKKLIGVATLDSTLTADRLQDEVLLYHSPSGCTFRFSPSERLIQEIVH